MADTPASGLNIDPTAQTQNNNTPLPNPIQSIAEPTDQTASHGGNPYNTFIASGTQQAIQSSAPSYNPLVQNPSQVTNAEITGATNPGAAISPNALQTYTPIQNQANNELNPQSYNAPVTTNTPTQQANASQIAQTQPTQASQYNAVTTQGAQGTVDPNSLVQNQMTNLLNNNLNANGVPEWAQPAVTAANQRMNSLGLGASTMAGNAEATAILSTALPMAEQNAQVYANLNLANLSNQQQAMLSNQAAVNAAQQFNATNEQQNAQFFATLTTNIATQNAQMQTAVSQFNAGQTNAATQFNQNLQNQQQEFSIGNQLLVDQSNVAWQRAINTANTAGINAANQANAQNAFNLSQTDMNNLWQEAQDEASWALTSSENAQNRTLSLVTSALNSQTSQALLASQESANMYSQLGQLGANILGSTISSFTSSNSGGGDGNFGGSSGGNSGNFDTGGGGTIS